MGSVASKLEEEEEVVSICRERKRLIMLAVDRRYALAEAHFRYGQALYAVSAAFKFFVARHSSPASPFLITFPPPCPPTPPATDLNVMTNPMLLHQRPLESTTHEAIACEFCGSSTSSGFSEEVTEQEVEGIPKLEEEGDTKEEEKKVVIVEEKDSKREHEEIESGLLKVKEQTHVSQGEQKRITVIDSPYKGRELLETLEDIEDYFIRAYDSGKDVSRMLEANMVHLQSGLVGIKGEYELYSSFNNVHLQFMSIFPEMRRKGGRENSTKIIQAVTWHRSTLSKPQSWSHSLTLGRLYAWEKNLYDEVKAGDSTRKIDERKCSRLRTQDVKGYDELTMDKTRAAVKDLYAQILIAIRSAESISKRIQKLRDEELLPQIIELLKGLTRTWKVMLESHETQNKIFSEVKSFACPSFGKFYKDTHRLATLQLEAELRNWRTCFTEGRSSGAPHGGNGPPLLVICYHWLASMEELPDKAVTFSLKSFSKDVKELLDFLIVFESLIEFSQASMKIYNELVTLSENAEKGAVHTADLGMGELGLRRLGRTETVDAAIFEQKQQKSSDIFQTTENKLLRKPQPAFDILTTGGMITESRIFGYGVHKPNSPPLSFMLLPLPLNSLKFLTHSTLEECSRINKRSGISLSPLVCISLLIYAPMMFVLSYRINSAMEVDHYSVLGLPSGEEGVNLTAKESTKAYREKARDIHPDKRKDDLNAHENFIKLKSSYEILVDEKARKLFDDLLRVKLEQQRRFAQQDSKRRKMMSDLEDRECASFAPDPVMMAKKEEERIERGDCEDTCDARK
ncbi:hypothetical protein F3Y22_tig00112411pilonHSYRG00012 [Hibiscus syriacus]|uniref:J domain-containing protein n=1 Tax=Hibiscus syriacus TaxID=106335 RepID=A0A6A2WZI0_HIBSY|nr:hypothetical protein F3Y22_tig00112411pilonHSYRG00012 [Hibiscus syriacus]